MVAFYMVSVWSCLVAVQKAEVLHPGQASWWWWCYISVAMLQGTRSRDLKLHKGNFDYALPHQGCLLVSSACAAVPAILLQSRMSSPCDDYRDPTWSVSAFSRVFFFFCSTRKRRGRNPELTPPRHHTVLGEEIEWEESPSRVGLGGARLSSGLWQAGEHFLPCYLHTDQDCTVKGYAETAVQVMMFPPLVIPSSLQNMVVSQPGYSSGFSKVQYNNILAFAGDQWFSPRRKFEHRAYFWTLLDIFGHDSWRCSCTCGWRPQRMVPNNTLTQSQCQECWGEKSAFNIVKHIPRKNCFNKYYRGLWLRGNIEKMMGMTLEIDAWVTSSLIVCIHPWFSQSVCLSL